MKNTGIVRRIDDLGRIVLPREIRKLLCIKVGDPLEFHIDEGAIVLKKYPPVTTVREAVKAAIDLADANGEYLQPDLTQAVKDKLSEALLMLNEGVDRC